MDDVANDSKIDKEMWCEIRALVSCILDWVILNSESMIEACDAGMRMWNHEIMLK